LMAEYPSIFDGICRPMRGPPCRFTLKEGAVPSAVWVSRPVAVPLMQKLKLELDSLEEQKIISKVTEPTVWVHPIVIVPKDNGGIRICGDFTSLNRWIIRPTFDAPTPFQAVRTIPPGMKFFTVIDALKGYHQVLRDEESSAMTTFSTPFGRYKYNRLPFGVSLAGDDYGRRLEEIFDGFPNYRRVVEDILVFSETWEEHVDLVHRLFRLAAEHNIAINVGKIVFGQPSVLFGGYVVSESGFRPSPDLSQSHPGIPHAHLRLRNGTRASASRWGTSRTVLRPSFALWRPCCGRISCGSGRSSMKFISKRPEHPCPPQQRYRFTTRIVQPLFTSTHRVCEAWGSFFASRTRTVAGTSYRQGHGSCRTLRLGTR